MTEIVDKLLARDDGTPPASPKSNFRPGVFGLSGEDLEKAAIAMPLGRAQGKKASALGS